jgi:hypothetical protein
VYAAATWYMFNARHTMPMFWLCSNAPNACSGIPTSSIPRTLAEEREHLLGGVGPGHHLRDLGLNYLIDGIQQNN